VIVSKPKKTAADFSPRDWVPLKAALVRIISITGSRDRGLFYLNRDLRSGRLRSAKVQISNGNEMVTRFNPSDWEQRTVEAALNPEEGVRVEPYEDGYFYVRAVDLDKHYPPAGTSTMTAAPQSDNAESSPTPAPEKQAPGIKPLKDWPNRLLAPEIVRVAYETPDLLLDRPELVKHIRNFLAAEIRWEPKDNKPIHRELKRLLSRIIT
jgi:hypothetical protein